MQNPETGKGSVWYEAAERGEAKSADGLFDFVGCAEKEMLADFWAALSKYDRCVTFNGRTFDGPFLSVRSAVHGLLPSKNLLGYRYSIETHVDLLEVLTFQGAVSRDQAPSLHAACVAFGIPSPKSEEMHGYAVGDLYRQGRLRGDRRLLPERRRGDGRAVPSPRADAPAPFQALLTPPSLTARTGERSGARGPIFPA